MRILVVEDDTATQQTVTLFLESHGWSVTAVSYSEDALDNLKRSDFDVITLDLNLPDMSGIEVLSELRAAGYVTPVLILSGLASIEDKVKGLDMGADDYMTKPFHSDELRARLRALCRRSAGLVCARPDDEVYIVDSPMEQSGLFGHRSLGIGADLSVAAVVVMTLENEQQRRDEEPRRIVLDFQRVPDILRAIDELALLGKFIVREKPWQRLDDNVHNVRRFAKASNKIRQYAKGLRKGKR